MSIYVMGIDHVCGVFVIPMSTTTIMLLTVHLVTGRINNELNHSCGSLLAMVPLFPVLTDLTMVITFSSSIRHHRRRGGGANGRCTACKMDIIHL